MLSLIDKMFSIFSANKLEKERYQSRLDTLHAFVQDAEHEFVSVITNLQAHLDLLFEEQKKKNMPLEKFPVIDRAVARILSGTVYLASVTKLANEVGSKEAVDVCTLMGDIENDTKREFADRDVSLVWEVPQGTKLVGDIMALKSMFTGIITSVLHLCKGQERVLLFSSTTKNSIQFDCTSDEDDSVADFKPWQLGNLKMIPGNGDGIVLSTVEAMARLNRGQLSSRTSERQKQSFRLVFGT